MVTQIRWEHEGGEKWLDSGCIVKIRCLILKIKSSEFEDNSDV